MTTPESGGEHISDEQVFSYVESKINSWNYAGASQSDTANFSFRLNHWLLETYGQQDNEGIRCLSTNADGVPGSEMPSSLQQLIVYSWNDELSFQDENRLYLRSQSIYYEHDPIIPKYEEIQKLATFKEQLEMARRDPEIRDHIVRPRVEIVPEVSINFEPFFTYGWGLEFVTNDTSVRVAPFGKQGKTWPAMSYAIENMANQAELSEVSNRLALLASRYSYVRLDRRSSWEGSHNEDVLATLDRRLSGAEEVEVHIAGDFRGRPGNAMKNLLIKHLLDEAEN